MSGSVFGAKPRGERLARVLGSKQFHDGQFENTVPVRTMKSGTALSTMREYMFGDAERSPSGPLPQVDPREAWREKSRSGLRATWISHSTVLLEISGLRVLTDPVFSERASPSQRVGPKRFVPAPIALRDLPKLDAVVISHDHYDHLDTQAVKTLAALDVPIFTSLGVGAHLEAWGVKPARITELDWWESATLKGTALTVTATPARHFSGRGPRMTNSTLWSSMVIQTPEHRVFFSGDTGPTPEFKDVRAKVGPFDLVMLEVGAWHPAWGDIHLGPEHALEAFEMLGGGALLPVHWGTFNLALHAWNEPLETLTALAAPRGVTVLSPRQGGSVEPAHPPPLDPWWRIPGRATSKQKPLLTPDLVASGPGDPSEAPGGAGF